MLRKICFTIITSALLVSPAMSQEKATQPYNCDYSPSCEVAPGVYGAMGSPVMSKFNLSIGGYIKLDYAHNTNPSGPTTSPAGAAAGVHKDESIFTAKQTRFWLKVAGPTFLGAKTNALVEADFYGANSLANEFGNMRMRHAYGSMDWANTQILFGQFWDIWGPAAADTLDFRQGGDTGAPNNPRVAQLRLTHRIDFNADNSLKFVLGLQNPVQDSAAVASNAQAGAGAPGTTYGSMVNAAGQIMFSSKALGVSPGFMGLGLNPLTVGVFGLVGNEKVTGNKTVDVYGYGAYGFVPLIKSRDGKHRTMTLSLETQAYMAAGMNIPGSTSLSVVGTKPDQAGAKGWGVYGQLKFYPTQDMGITGGYMRRAAINYDDYRAANPAFQKYNEISYGNITYDLNAAVRVATEFEHQVTQYGGVPAGAVSDRGQNNVARLSVYYFF